MRLSNSVYSFFYSATDLLFQYDFFFNLIVTLFRTVRFHYPRCLQVLYSWIYIQGTNCITWLLYTIFPRWVSSVRLKKRHMHCMALRVYDHFILLFSFQNIEKQFPQKAGTQTSSPHWAYPIHVFVAIIVIFPLCLYIFDSISIIYWWFKLRGF